MIKRWMIYILAAGLSLLLVVGALAAPQAYTLDWWTVDGGGGDSVGGSFALTGSLGQPDAGSMSGSGYQLSGGFLAGGPGAPPPVRRIYLPLVINQ